MPPRERGQRGTRDSSGRDGGGQLPWAVIYYRAPDQKVPALEFLDGCPGTIDAQFTAVLDAVAAAPPPRFSGGGKWEAMHGSMGGWYEIRLAGPGREQFRLFCLLETGTGDELARRCAGSYQRTGCQDQGQALPVPRRRRWLAPSWTRPTSVGPSG